MRSEQIDKKVQEAAEKHYPAYDEQAWQKMEKLLNQHLPVQKDDNKRRVFLLLLLFLLVGGGSFLLLSKPWDKNPDIASPSKGSNERPVNDKKPQSENASVSEGRPITPSSVEQSTPSSKTVTSDLKVQNKQSIPPSTRTRGHDLTRNEPGRANQADKNLTSKAQMAENNIRANNIDQGQPTEPVKETSVIPNSIEGKKDENVKQGVTKNVEAKSETSQNTKSQTAKPPIHKEKSNWLTGFTLQISAGPDVSKAGGSAPGKVTLAYGAGISYTKNRFSLRTGVYAARKIYNAGPNDYELRWQPSNIKFEGADANCYVIEIPVGLYYNFALKNKSNWFAGAGLSSYLMKSEKYNYQFKTSTGTPYYWPYDVKNENKHYFSVLNLSGGYTLHLNNTISLSAEPYLKIPLSGIGVGKVQLNSGGVLFTLGIKPFK